jgi:hypothetical protein
VSHDLYDLHERHLTVTSFGSLSSLFSRAMSSP